MKLSNQKNIVFYLRILAVLAVIHLLIFFYLFFVNESIQHGNYLKGLFLISLLILIITFSRLKCFEFDYSGEVISIISYHPFFPGAGKRVEFPKNKLDGFKVIKSNGFTFLKLYLKMFEDKTVRVRYKVYGLSDSLVRDMERSLQRTKELYSA